MSALIRLGSVVVDLEPDLSPLNVPMSGVKIVLQVSKRQSLEISQFGFLRFVPVLYVVLRKQTKSFFRQPAVYL